MEKDMILQYASGDISAMLAHTSRNLVRDVAFSLSEGESMALIGETGSGKTMIALSIMRLLPRNVRQTGGEMLFCGAALPEGRAMRALLGTQIAYIPQNGLEFLDPSKKIRYHLYDSLKKIGIGGAERASAAAQRLEAAGFSSPQEILEQYPFQLSGGMAQRVTIALAACTRARLIIADEPTNGLDQEGRKQFMARLTSLFPQAAKLVITHDIAVAALCARMLVLCGGRTMEQGPSNRLLTTPRNPYTRALIASLVENGMAETPLLRAGESGCPFYRRCAEAEKSGCSRPQLHRCGDVEWWCRAT
ncbi:MAG: ABC transporter ATP-binding protein [Oscillospiraceae bacterium]|nr:ABC transporter ATP-binding protein [Oscillospiraceae bacterium]